MTPTSPADATIHPTASIAPEAEIGEGVTVGPGCIIEGPAVLEPGVHLIANVHITGDTRIGEGTVVYPFACLGFGPQHIKIKPGDPIGGVRIGPGCTLREHTTVHAAMHEGANTVIGARAYIMVGGHIGHDSVIGDDVIICNAALIAGHCEIHDKAYLSGNCALHQFCRVGRGAMISGVVASAVDVPPYTVMALRNELTGLNLVGMRRAGIPREDITLAREAYRRAFPKGITRSDQLAILDEYAEKSSIAKLMADFVRGATRTIAHDRLRHIGTSANSSTGDEQNGTDDGVA
jgi:UDP-N-acetylglucosamine acyltransferase